MKKNNSQPLPPAQLFIGPNNVTLKKAQDLLQKTLCPNNGCQNCLACRQILDQQHHCILWLEPKKNYTREILEPIFKQISFSLEPEQSYFFVFQKAERLTQSCSNSLLKSVEEPPPGYHFLFLTERLQQILPTIQSRCTANSFYESTENQEYPLTQTFKNAVVCAPTVFLKLIGQCNPSEQETVEQLDVLLAHWLEKNKTSGTTNKTAQKNIAILKKALENPPMPGSSKLFWKNLYLQMK